MNEIETIKNELISLYNSIKNDFCSEHKIINNLSNNFTALSLIKDIKELICNNKNILSNKNLLINYHQLENQLRKIECDNKFLIGEIMTLQIMNTSLDIKLNTYISIENELDELKARVKFEEGKFLQNERKDNEILILRKENSSLKKRLEFLELKNKRYEQKKIEYKQKIQNMENIIQKLNKKINLLQIKIKNKENKTRNFFINNIKINKTIHSSSKIDLKFKTSSNNGNLFSKLNNQKYAGIRSVRNNSDKSTDIRNISNIFSPNNEYFLFEKHKNNSTFSRNNKIFDMTFNNIINKFNFKKIKIPFKKEFTDLIKKKGKESIKRKLNHETDENKNILNKSNKNNRDYIINSNNAENQNKFFLRIINKKE